MELDFKADMGEYLPLREVVFNTLRQAILLGSLKPGERLMEIKLAKKLGVSRTPIREAIRRLELEGLVKVEPRRGAEVADISEENLRDVMEVRRALEELAVRLACRRMPEGCVELMKQEAGEFKISLKKGDVTEMAEADVKFHDLIYSAADNKKLMQLLNNIREQMYRFRVEYLRDPGVYDALLKEHDEIIMYIASGDEERAVAVVGRHVDNQMNAISYAIRKKQ